MTDPTYKSYIVYTANTELAVTLERARMQLRNEDLAFDDEHLRGIIRAASDYVERTYGLALLTQTIKQYHSDFPCDTGTPLLLRITPLSGTPNVVVQYVDSAGATQTWTSSEYTTGQYNGRPFIIPKTGYSWPSDVDTDLPNAVTVTYSAGYGAKPSTVPPVITQALLLKITDLYENRTDPPRDRQTASDVLLQPFYQFSC